MVMSVSIPRRNLLLRRILQPDETINMQWHNKIRGGGLWMLLLLSFVLLAIYYRQKEGPTNRCPKTNEPSCLAELLRYNIIHRLIASGLRYHFQSAVQWSLQTGGGDRDDKYIVIESNPHFWSSPGYYDPPLPVAHSLLVLLNFLLTLGITD